MPSQVEMAQHIAVKLFFGESLMEVYYYLPLEHTESHVEQEEHKAEEAYRLYRGQLLLE